ncbi:MAG: hypothetical protein P8N72_06740 [Flavimaricola sp.]|nr:hypothetical protein [Flavimaricola sp.]
MSKIKLSTPLPAKLTDWLQDVYPAWLQLPESTFYEMVPFNSPQSPLQLNYSDCSADLAASSIFLNLDIFFSLISEGRIPLLENGSISSDGLDLLLETTTWPNCDMDMTRMMRRPLDQENIGPLDFLMALAGAAKLTKIVDGRLMVTVAGRRVCEKLVDQSIVRAVFEATFSKVNPRTLTKLAHPWVREQAGIIFWGLSITADAPRTVSELTRYCFVPPEKFLDNTFGMLEVYMRAVYLTPLSWFGLMATSSPCDGETHVYDRLYQKTALFDCFMEFDFEPAQPAERPN